MKRNCSLSPCQLAIAYAVLFVLSFAVAAAFMVLGAWHVFAFTMLEMLAVALAFLHYARHATDHERIALMDDCLLVEQVLAGETTQVRLDPYWTRIALPRHARELIALEARGVKVEVGGFVTEARRRQFARELREELRSSRTPPAAA